MKSVCPSILFVLYSFACITKIVSVTKVAMITYEDMSLSSILLFAMIMCFILHPKGHLGFCPAFRMQLISLKDTVTSLCLLGVNFSFIG